ncbi:MAG: hypothetical protein HON44_08480, partial [Glaciecola sp.]|nr:hypothetical protein [Glaciecola sp.]
MTNSMQLITQWLIDNLWWALGALTILVTLVTYVITTQRLSARYAAQLASLNDTLAQAHEHNTEYQVANGALSASLQALQQSSKEKMAL